MSSTSSSRLGRSIVAGCAALWIASLVTVLVRLPAGTPGSADDGAPVLAWWVVLLPSLVGIGLTLVLPARAPAMPVRIEHGVRYRWSTLALLALAVAFPVVVGTFDLAGGEGYVLAKAAMFMVVPAIVVGVLHGIRIQTRPGAWRWWAPAVVVVIWTLLSEVAPWNPTHDLSGVDPTLLIVAALATAITASVGEELFYRRWLQSRLEAGLGVWPGIALTSLLFAFMHLASHGTGELLLDVARVIVAQGTFGVFVGVLWWRYRNLAAIILAHLVSNGWAVVVHLLG